MLILLSAVFDHLLLPYRTMADQCKSIAGISHRRFCKSHQSIFAAQPTDKRLALYKKLGDDLIVKKDTTGLLALVDHCACMSQFAV